MGEVDDQNPSPYSSQSRISVHRVLGGGAVADVVLWRRRNSAVLLLTGATAAWYIFERAGYSILSLLANSFLLLVVILFLWARSASLLNRPLPPLPNLDVSDEVVEKAAVEARVWINRALAIAREIALRGNRKLFLEVILCLWTVSYVGSFFNFLTLVYIGIILSLTVPVSYHKYQDHVDGKLGVARKLLLTQYNNILSGTGRPVRMEKKTK